MQRINDAIAALPVWVAVLALVIIVCGRSQGTYWLARLGTTWLEQHTAHQQTGWRASLHRWLGGASVARGSGAIEKWGLIIVPLSFCTWGFQTLVQAGAGVLRLNWVHYTLAAIPGYFAWAIIYYTVGIAALRTASAAARGNLWAMGIMTIVVAIMGCYLAWRKIQTIRAAVKQNSTQNA